MTSPKKERKIGFWGGINGFFFILPVTCFAIMWSMATFAEQEKVPLFYLALRGVDETTQVRAVYPINLILWQNVRDAVVQIPKGWGVVRLKSTKQVDPHHYEHEFEETSQENRKHILKTTTPHLTVDSKTLAEARDQLKHLYPNDEKTWEQLREWGREVIRSAWQYKNATAQLAPTAIDYSEDEELWAAWNRLISSQPHAAQDLPRLQELVHMVYPQQADYDTAMNWARTLRKRWTENFEFVCADKKINAIKVILPPDTDTTSWWLLYQHVGLTKESRQAALKHWLHYYPEHKRAAALAWGRELEVDRRAAGEPLPPSTDTLAALCVVERLTGSDTLGDRCRKIIRESLSESQRSTFGQFGKFLYPNDDLALLAATGDPLQLVDSRGNLHYSAIMLLLLLINIHVVLHRVVALALELRQPDHPRYQAYRRRVRMDDWRRLLIRYAFVPLIAWIITYFTLPPYINIFTDSMWQVLIGVYIGIVFGGFVFRFICGVIALLLIRLGIDVTKTWIDEILGIALGGYVLMHFGNGPVNLILFAAFELLPMFVPRRRKTDPRPQEA